MVSLLIIFIMLLLQFFCVGPFVGFCAESSPEPSLCGLWLLTAKGIATRSWARSDVSPSPRWIQTTARNL